VALAAVRLGAGRTRAEDNVDPAVGITALVKLGERVEAGQPLAVIHANDDTAGREAEVKLRDGITISDTVPEPRPLIAERIG